MRDFEFIGISLQKDYNIDRTIYISDMTKELKNNQLEIGRNIKSDYEIILSKTTAVHLKQDYKKLLNRYVYGYYLQGDLLLIFSPATLNSKLKYFFFNFFKLLFTFTLLSIIFVSSSKNKRYWYI